MSDYLEIGKKQASVFTDNNIGYIESLITCIVPKKIMIMCYYILLRQKTISRIEDLPVEQKSAMWETAKEFGRGRLNNEGLIELCKCLYILEYFLQ